MRRQLREAFENRCRQIAFEHMWPRLGAAPLSTEHIIDCQTCAAQGGTLSTLSSGLSDLEQGISAFNSECSVAGALGISQLGTPPTTQHTFGAADGAWPMSRQLLQLVVHERRSVACRRPALQHSASVRIDFTCNHHGDMCSHTGRDILSVCVSKSCKSHYK